MTTLTTTIEGVRLEPLSPPLLLPPFLFHRRRALPPDCFFLVTSLQAAVLALAPATMVSRRVTQKARGIFIREINAGGLVLLNEASHPCHTFIFGPFFF